MIGAFREAYPGEYEFMPYRAPLILKVLKEATFPKLPRAQVNFMADSIAALGLVSARRSRDICAEDRAREKRAHHILRAELYIECSWRLKGHSWDQCGRISSVAPQFLNGWFQGGRCELNEFCQYKQNGFRHLFEADGKP